MIILIRKRTLVTFISCTFLCFSVLLFTGNSESISVFSSGLEQESVTVVIDAGHGGEDGGAVSSDGILEADLNLEISHRMKDLLWFCGQKTVMTRETAAAICDEGLATIRERKVSDIHNRVDFVNSIDSAVLISIHQNSLPSSVVTHGAQVFWNTEAGAEFLALSLQEALNKCINIGNEKTTRKIAPTIYLMKHVTVPAVLVECGFLSNPAETDRLQDPSYQRTLAMALAAGYLRAGEESI